MPDPDSPYYEMVLQLQVIDGNLDDINRNIIRLTDTIAQSAEILTEVLRLELSNLEINTRAIANK